jgi:hypothetical protein
MNIPVSKKKLPATDGFIFDRRGTMYNIGYANAYKMNIENLRRKFVKNKTLYNLKNSHYKLGFNRGKNERLSGTKELLPPMYLPLNIPKNRIKRQERKRKERKKRKERSQILRQQVNYNRNHPTVIGFDPASAGPPKPKTKLRSLSI